MITTIIMPVSRAEHLDLVFARLEMLQCDRFKTNLLVIVDGDKNLYVETRNKTQGSKFGARLCVQFNHKETMREHNIGKRRKRIAKIHARFQELLPECDYVFGIEDDTLIPSTALKKLERLMLKQSTGLASGVQVGRWGVPYVGAWTADDVYDPKQITSKQTETGGVEEVDATGLYCFLVRASDYKGHEFATFENNSMGCDVNFGLWLRKQGYRNYIDWSVVCGHYNGAGEVLLPKADTPVIQLTKLRTTWRFTNA